MSAAKVSLASVLLLDLSTLLGLADLLSMLLGRALHQTDRVLRWSAKL